MTLTLEAVAGEATDLAVDVLYSEKAHFRAATILSAVHFWLGIGATVIGVGAGFSGLSDLGITAVVISWLALSAAIITGLNTFLQLRERRDAHHGYGCGYNSLRKRLRHFVNLDCKGEGSALKLRALLDEFLAEKTALDGEAGQIPPWAYKGGKKSILNGEANYTEEDRQAAIGS